jgi:hypothetical protein
MIPHEHRRWIESFPYREISFGYGGMNLFSVDEIDEGQIGYSQSAEGASFCDGTPGSWQPEWTVIGGDTIVGDPIILDTSNPKLPVLTAMHGEGAWEPCLISSSLSAFALALETIHRLSAGRENPVELEQHRLSAAEKKQALETIKHANGDEATLEFWERLLESE